MNLQELLDFGEMVKAGAAREVLTKTGQNWNGFRGLLGATAGGIMGDKAYDAYDDKGHGLGRLGAIATGMAGGGALGYHSGALPRGISHMAESLKDIAPNLGAAGGAYAGYNSPELASAALGKLTGKNEPTADVGTGTRILAGLAGGSLGHALGGAAIRGANQWSNAAMRRGILDDHTISRGVTDDLRQQFRQRGGIHADIADNDPNNLVIQQIMAEAAGRGAPSATLRGHSNNQDRANWLAAQADTYMNANPNAAAGFARDLHINTPSNAPVHSFLNGVMPGYQDYARPVGYALGAYGLANAGANLYSKVRGDQDNGRRKVIVT